MINSINKLNIREKEFKLMVQFGQTCPSNSLWVVPLHMLPKKKIASGGHTEMTVYSAARFETRSTQFATGEVRKFKTNEGE